MSRTRRIAQQLLPVVVSTIALVWLASRFDMSRVVDALSWRVALVMLPALLLYGAITLLLESLSILHLVDSPPPEFGAWTAARIKCASYLLAIVNYTLGGAALSVLLRRRARIGLGQAASIVVLISLTDLMIVLALGTSSLASTALDPPMLTGIVSLAGLGFFGGLVLLRMPRRAQAVMDQIQLRFQGREDMLVDYPFGEQRSLGESLEMLRDRKWRG